MDAPWVRSPPNSNLEFIGADYATLASDLDWTLDEDGMYLAPGVMRFRKGWTLFRDIMEQAFSVTYPIDCFNCVGPRAITQGVKADRRRLELGGFTILPNNVLYPKSWISSHELVQPLPEGEARKQLATIVEGSWSIHLFGKMTNHLPIQSGSIVSEAFEQFTLQIPRRLGHVSSVDRRLGSPKNLGTGIDLRFPASYSYRSRLAMQTAELPNLDTAGSIDGRFEGLDLIFVRRVKSSRVDRATITASTSRGGRVVLSTSSSRLGGRGRGVDGSPGGVTRAEVEIVDATLKDVNAVLSGIVYLPAAQSSAHDTADFEDELSIVVTFGAEEARGKIKITGR